LGHIISKEGVSMDKQKTEAVLWWPLLRTMKAFRGFLGLIGYYWRFICYYGII